MKPHCKKCHSDAVGKDFDPLTRLSSIYCFKCGNRFPGGQGFYMADKPKTIEETARGGQAARREAHTLEIAGSTPPPATNQAQEAQGSLPTRGVPFLAPVMDTLQLLSGTFFEEGTVTEESAESTMSVRREKGTSDPDASRLNVTGTKRTRTNKEAGGMKTRRKNSGKVVKACTNCGRVASIQGHGMCGGCYAYHKKYPEGPERDAALAAAAERFKTLPPATRKDPGPGRLTVRFSDPERRIFRRGAGKADEGSRTKAESGLPPEAAYPPATASLPEQEGRGVGLGRHGVKAHAAGEIVPGRHEGARASLPRSTRPEPSEQGETFTGCQASRRDGISSLPIGFNDVRVVFSPDDAALYSRFMQICREQRRSPSDQFLVMLDVAIAREMSGNMPSVDVHGDVLNNHDELARNIVLAIKAALPDGGAH